VAIKASSSDLQELSPDIANACRAVTAFLKKLGHLLEKSSQLREKMDQYQRSIGQHIAAIKQARPDDWGAIVEAQCGLKRRRAYSFLALVNGTETVEEQRAKNRERAARCRQRRALRNAQDPPHPDLQAHIDELEAAREYDRDLAEQLRLAKIKITGLESEVEELKRENATLHRELAACTAPAQPLLESGVDDLKREAPRAHPLDAEADKIAERCRKIRAFLDHPEQHVDAIRKNVAEILHAVDPAAKGARPVSVLSDKLDVTAFGRAMCLPGANGAATVAAPAAAEVVSAWKPTGDGAEMPDLPPSLRRAPHSQSVTAKETRQ